MRFALLGNHPDGLDLARALTESGRHQLIVYSGPAGGIEALRGRGINLERPIGDLEEVLADPAVEAVIVAGRISDRPVQLRRALQSERHVLCVHPADQTADIAHEAAMIQTDTKEVLLPLLPDALNPLIGRLSELGLGEPRLVELERWSSEPILIETDPVRARAAVPDWDLLRAVGGEVAEVSAFATKEELSAQAPLFLTGRFEAGGLFRAAYLPGQRETRWRFGVLGDRGQAELTFSQGPAGRGRLRWTDADGREHEELGEPWDRWAAMVAVFEAAVERRSTNPSHALGAAKNPSTFATSSMTEPRSLPAPSASERFFVPPRTVRWQDEIRALELDAAVRRSVEYRRAVTLEYQEASEEVGFKGTMTLAGCGVLWGIIFLLILSVWLPRVGWLIVPLLAGFLVLQLFRWIIPAQKKNET